MKHCPGCAQTKPISDFYHNRSMPDGLTHSCKICHKKSCDAWRAAHPGKLKQSSRKNMLLKRYGLTLDDYKSMLASQNGVCKICQQPETHRSRGSEIQPLSVDHDHAHAHENAKVAVRGLLCNKCNRVVHLLQDDPNLVETALAYLSRSELSEGFKGDLSVPKPKRDKPRYDKDLLLRKRFGITIDDYERLSQSQNHLCAICQRSETRPSKHGTIQTLMLDRNIPTNVIRGLLCAACKLAMISIGDDPKLLRHVIAYLARFR